jgi:hypothetical protein
MSDQKVKYKGTGCLTLFAMLLTVLFIGLKLTGVITWSWFFVLSPLPIVFALYVVLLVLLVGFLAILGLLAVIVAALQVTGVKATSTEKNITPK